MADKTTDNRTLKHLKMFVPQTQIAEVTPNLVQKIQRLSPEEVHFSIRELQNKPKFIQQKHSTNSLETRGMIIMTDGLKLPIVALVDSGCSGSSIDESFVQENNIATYNLPIAIPVYNSNRTPNSNGLISKFVTIELVIGEHSERLVLAVTKLSTHSIFLEFDWLKEHNPIIDWKQQKIEFTCVDGHFPGLIPVEDEEEEIGHDKDEERLFQVDINSYIRANTATELAIKKDKEKYLKTFENVVPDHYHKFKDVFDKENFDELPPKRLWDHTVELLPGDHIVDCKTYNFMLDEKKELDVPLEENLKSGRIYPSKSPFASAFFFIKKKDGKLRPVQDYQKLNAITIKNRYPLPLISKLIDKLKNAKYFTKLDIRWEYNNIHMKEGDEWKAAFQTNSRLFEPLVMFFGLMNSPAMFQTMMNSLFRDLIN